MHTWKVTVWSVYPRAQDQAWYIGTSYVIFKFKMQYSSLPASESIFTLS